MARDRQERRIIREWEFGAAIVATNAFRFAPVYGVVQTDDLEPDIVARCRVSRATKASPQPPPDRCPACSGWFWWQSRRGAWLWLLTGAVDVAARPDRQRLQLA